MLLIVKFKLFEYRSAEAKGSIICTTNQCREILHKIDNAIVLETRMRSPPESPMRNDLTVKHFAQPQNVDDSAKSFLSLKKFEPNYMKSWHVLSVILSHAPQSTPKDRGGITSDLHHHWKSRRCRRQKRGKLGKLSPGRSIDRTRINAYNFCI